MAGTADADTATSVAADVRVDIPGWVIPAADGRAAVTPAAVTRAAVIQVVVIPAEVTLAEVIPVAAATHITKAGY